MEETQPIPPYVVPPAAVPVPPPSPPPPPPSLAGQVLRVAWLSIALGLFLELVLLTLAAYAGAAGSTPKPFVADLAQKVSWGFIVCVGIAFGTTAGKAREAVMGALGLLAAPAGFAVARVVHKAVSEILSYPPGTTARGSLFLIGGIKAIEYGALGAAVGWLSGKAWGGPGAHAGVGALIGLVFGGAILVVMHQGSPAPTPPAQLLSQGVSEFLFPIGCSVVLYISRAMAKRM